MKTEVRGHPSLAVYMYTTGGEDNLGNPMMGGKGRKVETGEHQEKMSWELVGHLM